MTSGPPHERDAPVPQDLTVSALSHCLVLGKHNHTVLLSGGDGAPGCDSFSDSKFSCRHVRLVAVPSFVPPSYQVSCWVLGGDSECALICEGDRVPPLSTLVLILETKSVETKCFK